VVLGGGFYTWATIRGGPSQPAADLNALKRLGFTAAALGNHEFDWGAAGLAGMILHADPPMVPLLCANINKEQAAAQPIAGLIGKEGESGKAIHPYIVRTLSNGLKVGVFGLIGVEAGSVSNTPLLFDGNMIDLAAKAQATVDTLRKQEKVDFVILLGHIGVEMDGAQAKGESVELAKKVCGIDVLLSGHNHTHQPAPAQIACEGDAGWSTVVMEAGRYLDNLGRIDLVLSGSRVKSATGRLVPIEDTLAGDSAVTAWEKTLAASVEDQLIKKFPIVPDAGAFLDGEFCQVLAQASFDIPRHSHEANNVQNLVSDAVRESCGCEMAAISNGGDVRDDLARVDGGFPLADVFRAVPLGIGWDGLAGYPAVKFFLRLQEIVLVLEFTTADKGLSNDDYFMCFSGFAVHFDSREAPLARVQKIWRNVPLDESGPGELIFDRSQNDPFLISKETLISVCTSSYIAQFLKSFNLNPRDSAGTPVDDLSTLVCKDGSREVKLWYALARKLAQSPGGQVESRFNDGEAAFPHWRRCRNLADHPL
jgi:UDP-sugar diphosphatase